jgi:hypothetical protein
MTVRLSTEKMYAFVSAMLYLSALLSLVRCRTILVTVTFRSLSEKSTSLLNTVPIKMMSSKQWKLLHCILLSCKSRSSAVADTNADGLPQGLAPLVAAEESGDEGRSALEDKLKIAHSVLGSAAFIVCFPLGSVLMRVLKGPLAWFVNG